MLPDALWSLARFSGAATLEASDVGVLAGYLSEAVLPRLRAGQRMFFNGEVTDATDDGTLYREPSERWRNYSLHYDVLERVIAFLYRAEGEVRIL